MSLGDTRPQRPDPGRTQPTDPGRTQPHDPSLDKTQSRSSDPGGTQPTKARRPKPRRAGGFLPLFIGMGAFGFVVLGLSGITGFWSGQQDLTSAKATQQANLLLEQFNLGVSDLEAGRLQLAQQRFDYILSVDPSYPNVHDLLNLTLAGLNQPTATIVPTATQITITPTPTISVTSLDGLLQAAQAAYNQQDWSRTIDILLTLRAKDPQYQLTQVNQLLQGSLRNRGLSEILQGQQEMGIYDLTLASRFGPLDAQAASWERSAEFYLYANSFYGLDWQQAAGNFSSLCAAGIWDSCYKYAVSAASYGDLLIKDSKDYCAASDQYAASLDTRSNPALEPTATAAHKACLTATAGPPTATPSPTAGTITPTVLGFPTSTSTSPAGPSATPSPTTAGAPTHTRTPSPTSGPTSTPTPSPTSGPTDTPVPTAPPTATDTPTSAVPSDTPAT